MRKFIMILAVAVTTLCIAPAAQASTFLPMWQGKAKARSTARKLMTKVDGGVDSSVWGCFRLSRSTIQCDYDVSTADGVTCESAIRVRKTSYNGYLSVSFPVEPECY